MPKGGANKIGRAGNDDPKARTVPRKGNKGNKGKGNFVYPRLDAE
jgi:hypothetical protein